MLRNDQTWRKRAWLDQLTAYKDTTIFWNERGNVLMNDLDWNYLLGAGREFRSMTVSGDMFELNACDLNGVRTSKTAGSIVAK